MNLRITMIALLLSAVTATATWGRVPRKPASAFDKGTEAYDNRQYEQTIACMDEALAKHAENGYALAYKGSALRMLDRLDEAAATLERATALIDDVNTTFRAWTRSERFLALVELGDTVAALAEIDQAIADDARQASYLENRAIIHACQGRLEAALADYDRALALNPGDELRQARQRVADAMALTGSVDEYSSHDERDITEQDEVTLPQFPGGNDALTDHISRLTGWDQTKPSVRVLVEATIDEQGNVVDAVLARGVNDKRDKKAVEICRGLPPFAPATHHGKPIRCNLMIPVRFEKK